MKSLLQKALIIVAAMVGSGVMLVLLITITKNLTVYGNSPADFLPEDRTHVLLHNPTQADMKWWNQRFTALDDVIYQSGTTIAVVSGPNDLRSAVTFSLRQTVAPHTSLGAYSVTSTDDTVISVLGTQELPLSKNETYALLASKKTDRDRWEYITRNTLRHGATLIDRIMQAALFGTKDAIAKSGENIVDLERTHDAIIYRQAPLQIANANDAFFIIATVEGSVAWQQLRKALNKDDAIVIEGIISAALQRFGKEISIVADILPLIAEPSALQLIGSNDLLLEGSMSDTTQLHATLERLHVGYTKTLPSLRVIQRVLDKRFSSVDIRNDPSLIFDDQQLRHGWSIRSTAVQEQQEGLFSATQGNRFLITTNADILEQALTQTRQLTLPESKERGTVVLGGMVKIDRLRSFLGGLHPKTSQFFADTQTGTLLFSSLQTGRIRHLLLQMENGDLSLDSLL